MELTLLIGMALVVGLLAGILAVGLGLMRGLSSGREATSGIRHKTQTMGDSQRDLSVDPLREPTDEEIQWALALWGEEEKWRH